MDVARAHGADWKQISKNPTKFLRVILPKRPPAWAWEPMTLQTFLKWSLGSQASMAGSGLRKLFVPLKGYIPHCPFGIQPRNITGKKGGGGPIRWSQGSKERTDKWAKEPSQGLFKNIPHPWRGPLNDCSEQLQNLLQSTGCYTSPVLPPFKWGCLFLSSCRYSPLYIVCDGSQSFANFFHKSMDQKEQHLGLI